MVHVPEIKIDAGDAPFFTGGHSLSGFPSGGELVAAGVEFDGRQIGSAEWFAAFGELGAGGNREGGGRRGVGRHNNFPFETAIAEFPRTDDFAVDGVQLGARLFEFAAGLRREEDVLVARLRGIDLDAGDDLIQPAADRAVGVVVEGVHALVLEALFGRPTVPAFPNGRGALRDGVEPGWPLLLVQQFIGDVDTAET